MEAEHKMARRIQLRRDTATAWAAANPVLSQGEIGLDLTSKKIKIGDGTTLWNALAYWDDKETNLTGYATELYVDNAIGAITIPTYISQFGEGFSLTDTDKIVTNKLYSTNLTQPNQHYRLEVDTNGVVVLPDSSIINGSTIRGVAGTGELNYAGITIGPNSNDAEKTWMWVDHENAYITTNNAANTWTFGNNGSLTFPDSTVQTTAWTGSVSSLVNGDYELVVETDGIISSVAFPERDGGKIYLSGVEIGAVPSDPEDTFPYPLVLTSQQGNVRITPNAIQAPRLDWEFGADGTLSYPKSALQRDTATVACPGNASTVVYTASGTGIHTIRLLIQVEGTVGAAVDWDTQACEMIIAKSFRANEIAASVYGIVYTSVAPLATFTANWNALTSRVEVLCTTPSANTVSVRIFATEITTSD